MSSPSPQARNSTFELLRILAMGFIVTSHCSVHSWFPTEPSRFLFNNIFIDWCVLGNLGVDLFVMISGYFLCTRSFRFSSLEKLFSQVWFYSLFGFGISFLFGFSHTREQVFAAFFPTIFEEYWFFTAYIILMLLTPCLNLFFSQTSKQQQLIFIGTLFFVWVVLPTLTRKLLYGTELAQFILFYSIGAFFRKFPEALLKHVRAARFLAIGSFLLLLSSSVFLRFAPAGIFEYCYSSTLYFYSRNSIFVVLCAIGFLGWAVFAKPFHSRLINRISSCTFGVYLFHDNPYMRELIWARTVNNAAFYDSYLLPVRMLIAIAVVYLVGICMERLRQVLVEPVSLPLTHALFSLIEKPAKHLIAIFHS